MKLLACVEKCEFWKHVHSASSIHIVEFNIFYLVAFGLLLTYGTIFDTVDFDAEVEEEEVEPKETAPPDY